MLKSTLTALLLSSVALVPAATIAVVATADAAHAKSDKAGGNGNGGGNGNKGGNSANAKSKSTTTASRGNGGGSGKTRVRSGDDPVGNFIRKLTGQDKKKAKTTRTKTRSAAPQVAKAPKAREKDAMHPSNLGNMNGALNANVNAVAAHIRNGNTNGPVGHLAALAVANASAAGAQEVVDAENAHQNLDDLLGEQTVEEYLDQRNGVTDPAVEEALAALDGLTEEDEGYEEAVTNLEDALGDRSLEEYEAAREGDGGNADIDEAIAALGGNAEDGTAPTAERPSEEDVAEAEENLEAQSDAEGNILAYWNKNPDANPDEVTEEEQALLDKLNERLEADSAAIEEAIATTADGDAMDEDAAECDTEDGCEAPEDEDVASVTE